VSAAAIGAAAPAPSSTASASPWLIAVLVALAAFMEVLDTTIANVVLPYIAGGMGVSEDEASWVVTTYLVANAVSLTASPFLSRRLGRKAFFLSCLALFTLSSVACAEAWSLQSLLIARLLQGLAGGGMVPAAQSILADSFPPQKRGQAFALFGVAVVVAPVVGPTLGGWLADNLSWRWCFMINGPVGLVTMALIAKNLRESEKAIAERELARGRKFDLIGFLLVATFLGALEVMLDRGLNDDWFGSSFIVVTAVVCSAAFVLMIPWEMMRQDPTIDVRMVATRQFGPCFAVMAATGAILYATTQFLPQVVQQQFGYTATWAGLVLSPGGLVTLVMMFVIGKLSERAQPKYLIMTGALLIALSLYTMTNIYGDLDFWFFARSRMLLGVGLPLIFIPIMAASRVGFFCRASKGQVRGGGSQDSPGHSHPLSWARWFLAGAFPCPTRHRGPRDPAIEPTCGSAGTTVKDRYHRCRDVAAHFDGLATGRASGLVPAPSNVANRELSGQFSVAIKQPRVDKQRQVIGNGARGSSFLCLPSGVTLALAFRAHAPLRVRGDGTPRPQLHSPNGALIHTQVSLPLIISLFVSGGQLSEGLGTKRPRRVAVGLPSPVTRS